MPTLRAGILAFGGVLFLGCSPGPATSGDGGPGRGDSGNPGSGSDAGTSPGNDAGGPGGDGGLLSFPAVWVILMENHTKQQVLADPGSSYIQALVSGYATVNSYSTPLNPSLPNYVEIACGCDSAHSSFDASDSPADALINGSSNSLYTDPSLGGALEAAGVPWRAYGQDSQNQLGNCSPSDTGEYAARHMPFVYFQDVFGTGGTGSATCVNRVRVFGDYVRHTGDFFTDLAAGTYRFQWITPDLIYDMHDGTVANGNDFLNQVVPVIQASAQYQAGGVILITWDEGSGSNDILFIAVSKRAKAGYVSQVAYTHPNLLATLEDIFGLPRVGDSAGAAAMTDLFHP